MNVLMLSEEFNGFWRLQFGEDYTPSNSADYALDSVLAKYRPELLDEWTRNRVAELERQDATPRLASMFDALAYGHSPKKRPSFAFPFVQPLFSPTIIPA